MIAEIVANASGTAPRADDGRSGNDTCSRLLLNVVRGLMVLLVVSSHWVDGFVRRAPKLGIIETLLNPLLNWPTPGFAMAFGMTLGFVYYPAYRTSPTRTRGLL